MTDSNIDSIAKKSVKGIFALTSRTFFLNLISLGAFLVVTSVLPPKDIGLYTAVIAIQRIISFFTDFGLGAALIQKKDELEQRDLMTSFTLQFLLTFTIFLIVFLLQNQIGSFLKLTYDARMLLLSLVFTIFLSSFKTIPSILLERSINFSRLVIPQIVEALFFNGILILLVLSGYNISAFTWAFLISSLCGIPAYYLISPWKIRFGVDRRALTHLKFGLQFQVKNILATLKDDLLTVLLTKLLSFTQIGYIGFAQRLAFYAYRYIVDSVTKVTFSTYSRLQHDIAFLKVAIEKSLFYISLIMFPLLTGLIITIPYIISFYPKWHGKWEPAYVSLIFFALNAAVSSLSGVLVNILDATGHVKTTLRLMVIWTVMTWVLTPLLIWELGYNGVALASFIVTLTIGYTIYLVKQYIPFSFIKSVQTPFIGSILMGIIIFFLARLVVMNVLTLIFVILIGGLLYSIFVLKFAGSEILPYVRQYLGRYGRK